MLHYAVVFLVIALVAALLGFTGIAAGAAGIAKILFVVFLIFAAVTGVAIALGLGTKGRVDGIWIDERNRVSLARAQVTLWTIVALGGFATIALFNVGLGGPVAFPVIPGSIAAALGTHPQYQGPGGCDDSGRVRERHEGFLGSRCFSGGAAFRA